MSQSRINEFLFSPRYKLPQKTTKLPKLKTQTAPAQNNASKEINNIIRSIDNHLNLLQSKKENLKANELPKINLTKIESSGLYSQKKNIKTKTPTLFKSTSESKDEKPSQVNKSVEDSNFFEIMKSGKYSKVKLLIAQGFGVKERTKTKDTTLIAAIQRYSECLYGSKDRESVKAIIEDLCQLGGSNLDYFNTQNIYGNTALHYAIYLNEKWLVQLLMQNNASVIIENRRGLTPLQLGKEKYKDKMDTEIVTELNKHSVFTSKMGFN